eukprot:COSAG04_NODE_20377_length_395_cov_0.648649_1_plen_77_part_10
MSVSSLGLSAASPRRTRRVAIVLVLLLSAIGISSPLVAAPAAMSAPPGMNLVLSEKWLMDYAMKQQVRALRFVGCLP